MGVCGLRGGDVAGMARRGRRGASGAATACLSLALLAGCNAPGSTTEVKVESPTPRAASTPRESPKPSPPVTAAAAATPAPGASLKKTNLTPEDRRAWRKIVKWPDECEEAYEKTMSKETPGLEFYELAAGRCLVQIVCTTGAYQGYQFYASLDETKSPPASRLLTFPTFQSEDEGKPKQAEMQEMWGMPTFDTGTKRLQIHNRYRGPGDCGSLATYEFPDGSPRLKEFREKSACDGEYVEPEKWPRIFP